MLVDSFFMGVAESISDAVADPFQLRCFPESPKALPSSASAERSPAAPAKLSGSSSSSNIMERHLNAIMAPDRKHTKHHLVRMWAAERILRAERRSSRFEPIAPALEPPDVELRASARFYFFGAPPDQASTSSLPPVPR